MIHQYKLSGYNIVLDVYSGSVHAVDDVAYDAIALIDQGSSREQAAAALAKKYADRADVTAADIGDVLDDIDELTAAGQLFAPDAYADHAFDFKNRSNVVKALCLHVAHTCNLNCSYCFAAQGKFHGEAGLMSFETGKRALDFLIENSGTRRNLEVDFFGGEPLMNFEVCKQLVAYARSIEKKYNKNFRFTMTTNGIGITDEVIDWCNKECHNVVLSLDGRKEVNDRFRVDLAGNGSYDRIVPKFQKLVKARGGQGYYMRGTFTHHNVDFTKDLFHMADDLGFTELSMEPVVAPPDSPEALTEDGESLSGFFSVLEQGEQEHRQRFNGWLGNVAQAIRNIRSMLAGDIIIGGEAAHYLDDDDVTTLKRLVEERSAFHTDHFTLRKSLCLDNQNEIGAALRFVQTFIDEICGHAA